MDSYEGPEFELLLSHRTVNSASSAQKADAAQMQVNDVLCLRLGSHHQSLTTYYKDLKNLKKKLVHKTQVFLHNNSDVKFCIALILSPFLGYLPSLLNNNFTCLAPFEGGFERLAMAGD